MTGIYGSEHLNNNLNFSLLVKALSHADLSRFVYYIAIIADEKVQRDTRNWANDELNVFLNKMLKERGVKWTLSIRVILKMKKEGAKK